MLTDFINENLPKVDYKLKIQLFNPLEPQQEYANLIVAYMTPSRLFIKKSARNIGFNDVELDTLVYIIETCHQCTEQQKYEASIVALHKFQQACNDVALTNQMKQEIMDLFDYSKENHASDFAWADQHSDGSQKIFYLLNIMIGANKLIKLGITSDRLRQRLAVLKSDIKSNYQQHYIHIEPLLIVDCTDNEQFENEIKIVAMEHGHKNTNYNFRGSTETFGIKCKDVLIQAAIDLSEKNRDTILFNDNGNSGSKQQEEQQFVIPNKAELPFVYGDI